MREFGYRIDFSKIPETEWREKLIKYCENFSIFEIKLSYDFFDNGFKKLLDLISLNPKFNFSVHLPKRIIMDDPSYKTLKNLFLLFEKKKFSKTIRFVTHLPETSSEFEVFFEAVKEISKVIPENCVLLLENPVILEDYKTYFESLNNYLYKIRPRNIKLGICFDIGHLLFSTQRSSLESVFSYIYEKREICINIDEFHIHDYNESKDHLPLASGRMDTAKVISLMNHIGSNIPTIIEVTVPNNQFAKEQIKKLLPSERKMLC